MSDARHRRIWRTRVTLIVLMLCAAPLAVAASAWACNPQAHVALDKSVYESASTMTVNGSYFTGVASITVMISGSTASTTVQTSPGGGFTLQLTAPSIPGNYTITASKPTGGFAPASFSVVAATQTPPVPDPPAEPAPVPAPVLPSPGLAPEVAGPTILRPTRLNEIVRVSPTGALELFCGRFAAPGVRGTCGAVATASLCSADAGSRLQLRPKPFRAQIRLRVLARFHLRAGDLKCLTSARQVRMRATVVATNAIGSQTTKTFTFTLKPARTTTA